MTWNLKFSPPMRKKQKDSFRCSSKLVFLKISKLHRKTSALESLFNKVPRSQTPTLVLCFPLNIATFLRTSFYRTHLVAASGISPVLKRKQASGL